MDLKSIYEFRTRLYAVTMAGTQLVMEDYRLKRAIEELQPLEKVSPVFSRIVSLGKQLLSPDCKNKEGILLDCITLTDAILCTQGTVAVSSELKEVENIMEYKEENSMQNIPYSILHSLMESLTGTGSGRYAFVESLHTTHPQYFEDYRVKRAMVEALSDSYAELADNVEGWIRESGESFVPFLKRGFLQKKPSATVKVVQLIEDFCKEKENAFYLEKLKESEKEVRGALIFALRHAKENTELLLHLARTEKGATKKMAYWALADMEGAEVEQFWNDFYKKKQQDVIEYLTYSKTNWASVIVAKEFQRLIDPWTMEETPKVLTNEMIKELEKTIDALEGKTGSEISECYQKVMQIRGLLAECKEFSYLRKDYMNQTITREIWQQNTLFYRMGQILQRTLIQCFDKELSGLAIEFYEKYGEAYFSAAVVAKLLENHKEVLNWIVQQYKEEKVSENIFIRALELIEWDKEQQAYVFRLIRRYYYQMKVKSWEIITPILVPLDEDTFISYIMGEFATNFGEKKIKCEMDCVMSQWIRGEDTSYCKKLEEYYYKKALYLENNIFYLPLLKSCYAKECDGLAVNHLKRKAEKMSLWEIGYYFRELPGTVENKEKEARAVYDLILSGDIPLRYKEKQEYLQNQKEYFIQEWANS